MRRVIFHLDFISPYTWLALMQARAFGERHGVQWELCPVVYAALLDAHGLVGPVETAAKRRYTICDVARSASALGLRVVGPPEHPFRSIEALQRGVFGVPTFAIDDELFWGHDRMEPLAQRIAGDPPPPSRIAERMIARPSGADRKARKPKS